MTAPQLGCPNTRDTRLLDDALVTHRRDDIGALHSLVYSFLHSSVFACFIVRGPADPADQTRGESADASDEQQCLLQDQTRRNYKQTHPTTTVRQRVRLGGAPPPRCSISIQIPESCCGAFALPVFEFQRADAVRRRQAPRRHPCLLRGVIATPQDARSVCRDPPITPCLAHCA